MDLFGKRTVLRGRMRRGKRAEVTAELEAHGASVHYGFSGWNYVVFFADGVEPELGQTPGVPWFDEDALGSVLGEVGPVAAPAPVSGVFEGSGGPRTVSPCGRFAAVADDEGAWVVSEASNERVARLDGAGGAGREAVAFDWSAESSRLAVAFDGGEAAVYEPFMRAGVLLVVDVSAGSGVPPLIALSPDGTSLFVGVGCASGVPGSVVPVLRGRIVWDPSAGRSTRPSSDLTQMSPSLMDWKLVGGSLRMEWCAGWSPDGARIFGASRTHVFAIDRKSTRIAWINPLGGETRRGEGENPLMVSADGSRIAYWGDGYVKVADAVTGEVSGEYGAGEWDPAAL
ncbi:MAG TPA: hypothetical protein VGF17_12225, partial [Phytomonospora sp.]